MPRLICYQDNQLQKIFFALRGSLPSTSLPTTELSSSVLTTPASLPLSLTSRLSACACACVCVCVRLRRMCQNAYTFFSGTLFTPPYNLRLIQPQQKGSMTEAGMRVQYGRVTSPRDDADPTDRHDNHSTTNDPSTMHACASTVYTHGLLPKDLREREGRGGRRKKSSLFSLADTYVRTYKHV